MDGDLSAESDPVFSLDLSDPTNPQVTGELKIPGFSDYLQLIDENHLLAIGRGATSTGRDFSGSAGFTVRRFRHDVAHVASSSLL